MTLPYRGLYRIRASTHLRALCANIATAHLQDIVCVCVRERERERERARARVRLCAIVCDCVRVGMCVCVYIFVCVYLWYARVYIYTTHHLLELRPIKLAGLGEVLARKSQTSVPQYICHKGDFTEFLPCHFR